MQKLVKIALHSAALSLPLNDAAWAVDILRREAASAPEQVGASLGDLALRFAAGRAEIGDQVIARIAGPQWSGTMIQQALIEPAYRPFAIALLSRQPTGAQVRWPPLQDCYGTLLKLSAGDTGGATAAMRRLHAFEATDPPPLPSLEWQQSEFRVCDLLLQALVERTPARGEARPSLDRLDSLMQFGPRGFLGPANFAPTAYANFTIARLREAQGDLPRARAAIRRRDVDYFPAYTWSLAAFLRQEGRLAALSGDTSGALRAYDSYLAMRTAPDAVFRSQRDSVIAERARVLTRPRA